MRFSGLVTAVILALATTTLNAQERVGLVYPVYEDGTNTLYYAEVIPANECSGYTPAYYWANAGSMPCPWEVCDADFVFRLTVADDVVKEPKISIRGFDRSMPETLPDDIDINELIPTQHAHRNGRWRPNRGIVGNAATVEFIRIGSTNNPVVAVRWFTIVPTRRRAGLPDAVPAMTPGSRASLNRPLERAMRLGFQVNRPHNGETIVQATRGRSDFQATFTSEVHNVNVLVITQTDLVR